MSEMTLPEGWVTAQTGEIFEVVSGGTPKSGDDSNFTEAGKGIAWITPADLSGYQEKYIKFGRRDLSIQGYKTSSAKIVPEGSLVFSSRAPIGYVAIAKNEISTNQGFKNFVSTKYVDSVFAYFYFKSIRELAESLGTGTTFKEISASTAKTLPFIIPPLAEQKVIADQLDTLLAQVERTKARLERVPDILKQFRQSVLAAAVSGELTEGWRGKTQYNKTDFGMEIPATWNLITIDDIASVKGGKRLPKGDVLTENDTGYRYIRAGQLKNGTVLNGSDVRNKQLFITKETFAQIRKYTVSTGDIYLTIVGASIGDAGVVPKEFDSANLTENAAKLCEFKQEINSEFLGYWLRSQFIQDLIQLEIKSGAQGKLALMRIKTLPFPSTSLEEQTEIVRRVETLFAHADKIEQQAQAGLARVNQLTQSILAKAFRGELTAQWRKDNPELISGENSAEVLLERIRAEKAAMGGKKAGKKAE